MTLQYTLVDGSRLINAFLEPPHSNAESIELPASGDQRITIFNNANVAMVTFVILKNAERAYQLKGDTVAHVPPFDGEIVATRVQGKLIIVCERPDQ